MYCFSQFPISYHNIFILGQSYKGDLLFLYHYIYRAVVAVF